LITILLGLKLICLTGIAIFLNQLRAEAEQKPAPPPLLLVSLFTIEKFAAPHIVFTGSPIALGQRKTGVIDPCIRLFVTLLNGANNSIQEGIGFEI
jgi:hypothetical protein